MSCQSAVLLREQKYHYRLGCRLQQRAVFGFPLQSPAPQLTCFQGSSLHPVWLCGSTSWNDPFSQETAFLCLKCNVIYSLQTTFLLPSSFWWLHHHHWGVPNKTAACLSEPCSQRQVMHTPFDFQVGGSPSLCKEQPVLAGVKSERVLLQKEDHF